jgi:hypothetical protein
MHKLCSPMTSVGEPIVVVATVVLHSTRGTAGPDLWFRRSVDRPVARGYVRGKRPERLSRPNPSRGQCDDTSFNAVADFGLRWFGAALRL